MSSLASYADDAVRAAASATKPGFINTIVNNLKTGHNWWKVGAAVGIPAAAIGGYFAGVQTAPPKVSNLAEPGGIIYIGEQSGAQTANDPWAMMMPMMMMMGMMMIMPKIMGN